MTPTAELVSQEQLAQEIAPVCTQAQGITITDHNGYAFAIDFLKQIKGAQDRVTSFFKPLKDAAHEAHKKLCAAEKAILSPLNSAEVTVKAKALAFQREQEAKREAERRRLQAEADERARKEREALEKKAAKIKTPEKREALLAEAAEIAAPIVEAPASEKVAGVAPRKTWKARVANESLIPREYMTPNMDALNALARSMNGKITIPGVEFYPVESLAVGRN